MPVVSKEVDPAQWRQSGLRMHPEVRKALGIAARTDDMTMEDMLHRVLVRELRERSLLPAGFGEGR